MPRVRKFTGLESVWMKFAKEVLHSNTFIFLSIRKMIKNRMLSIKGEEWDSGISLSYHEIGYGVNSTKEKQLIRNYFNEEECTKVNEVLRRRIFDEKKKQSSLQLVLNNQVKKKSNQGFCMQGLVVSHFNINREDMIYITINYRTTEILQKFLADLKFLHEIVIPNLLKDIDIPIKEVRFNFATAYLSVMFLPVIYQFIYPQVFLNGVEEDDRFFIVAMRDLKHLIKEDLTYTYRTKRIMMELFYSRGLKNKNTISFMEKHTGD